MGAVGPLLQSRIFARKSNLTIGDQRPKSTIRPRDRRKLGSKAAFHHKNLKEIFTQSCFAFFFFFCLDHLTWEKSCRHDRAPQVRGSRWALITAISQFRSCRTYTAAPLLTCQLPEPSSGHCIASILFSAELQRLGAHNNISSWKSQANCQPSVRCVSAGPGSRAITHPLRPLIRCTAHKAQRLRGRVRAAQGIH